MTNDELDRLCAEKIMEMPGKYHGDGKWATWDVKRDQTKVIQFQPTRNIAQAWELLEKFPQATELTLNKQKDAWICFMGWWADRNRQSMPES